MSKLEKDASTEYEYASAHESPMTALERVKYLVGLFCEFININFIN